MSIPIKKWLDKVPGGIIIVPLFLGCIINTLFPAALQIGSFTTGILNGTSALVGLFFICMGAQLDLKCAPQAMKTGFTITIVKFAVSVGIGLAAAHFFHDNMFGLSALAMGERPRVGRAPQVLLALQALAVAAFFANRALGTDFLFLAAPPVRTPLEGIYRLSYGAYIAFLQGMMALLAWGMDAAGRRLFGRDDRPADFFAIQNSPNAV